MANYGRRYQKATHEQLQECVKWCQNILNLRDWHIEFRTGTYDKKELAAGWTMAFEEKHYFLQQTEIWVDLDYCKAKDKSPYVVVCHEMLHVLISGKCRIVSDDDEHITYTLDDLLYEKFCREKKIKMTQFREL